MGVRRRCCWIIRPWSGCSTKSSRIARWRPKTVTGSGTTIRIPAIERQATTTSGPTGAAPIFPSAAIHTSTRCCRGSVHSGLTRVVWELNEVGPGDGGTMFLTGSHKAAFPRPEEVSGRESPLWETYTCPPGSAVIFTEALCHTGTRWTNESRDRLSLFTCYNTVNAKWGKGCPAPEVIASLPPKRQTLFRGVWHGMREVPGINQYVDEANRAV